MAVSTGIRLMPTTISHNRHRHLHSPAEPTGRPRWRACTAPTAGTALPGRDPGSAPVAGLHGADRPHSHSAAETHGSASAAGLHGADRWHLHSAAVASDPANGAGSGLRPTATRGTDPMSTVAKNLVIELDNQPGELAKVATAISDAGVNISAATCIGTGARAELHILVPHAEPVRRALAITNTAVTREREVVVVQAQDRPGELATLAHRIAEAGINLDLVYVATNSRVVVGSEDIDALKQVLDGFSL